MVENLSNGFPPLVILYCHRKFRPPCIGIVKMQSASLWQAVSISTHCPRSPHATPLPLATSLSRAECTYGSKTDRRNRKDGGLLSAILSVVSSVCRR